MTNAPHGIALVMGLGRSGTTFLAKLIDSSPDVLYRHEPDAVLPTDLPAYVDRDHLDPYVEDARAYVSAMAKCRHWRCTDRLPIFSKSYRSRPADLLYRLMIFSGKTLRRYRLPLSDGQPDLIRATCSNVTCVIKSVSALGRARLFSEAVPSMPIVHVVRHPCAVFASLKTGLDKGLMAAKPKLNELLKQAEVQNYPFSPEEIAGASFEEQVAYRWMLTNDKAANDMAGSPGYLRICYEDLCSDVEQVSRRLFDHLGIERGGQTQRFIDSVTAPQTAEQNGIGYFDVKRPITSAVDKWTSQLDADTVARIAKIVSHSPLGQAYFDRH